MDKYRTVRAAIKQGDLQGRCSLMDKWAANTINDLLEERDELLVALIDIRRRPNEPGAMAKADAAIAKAKGELT